MKKNIAAKVIICVCAALGWWGVLYPELTLTPDTYTVVSEETAQKWNFDSNIYRDLLEAEEGKIIFKSRLLKSKLFKNDLF